MVSKREPPNDPTQHRQNGKLIHTALAATNFLPKPVAIFTVFTCHDGIELVRYEVLAYLK